MVRSRSRLLVGASAAISTSGALISVTQGVHSSAAHVIQVLRLHVDSTQLVADGGSLDVLHLGRLDSVQLVQVVQNSEEL